MSNEDFGQEASAEIVRENFSQTINGFVDDLSEFMREPVIQGDLDSSVAIAKLILSACETRRSVLMGMKGRIF